MLVALGGSSNDNITNASLFNLLTLYFVTSDLYKDLWDEVIPLNDYTLPKIDACGTKAVPSVCDLNTTQMCSL